jgi:hypothetical protein
MLAGAAAAPEAVCSVKDGRTQQQPAATSSWKQKLRVIVFIDDLDRCRPNKVVEVLEATNVVLRPSGFTVVAGMVSLYPQSLRTACWVTRTITNVWVLQCDNPNVELGGRQLHTSTQDWLEGLA